jgi:transcriptional regulator with XRE-family HTH domain
MTLRQLGEAAGQDYVLLNKVELGLRMPPPLEAILALADALSRVKPLSQAQIEKLIDLAAEPNARAGARFTQSEVDRLKSSRAAALFFTRRARDKGR